MLHCDEDAWASKVCPQHNMNMPALGWYFRPTTETDCDKFSTPHTPVTAAVAVAVANADGAIVLSTSCCAASPGTASGLIDSLPPSLLLPLLPAAAPPLLLGLLLLLSGIVSAAGHEAIGLRPPPAAAAAARAAASCFAFLRLAAETAAHQLAASKASKP